MPRGLSCFMGHARRSMNYVCSIAALFSQILPLELAFCKAAPKLAFNDGGTFKILQLADLHYGHFPEIDERTDKVSPLLSFSTSMYTEGRYPETMLPSSVRPSQWGMHMSALSNLFTAQVSCPCHRSLQTFWRMRSRTLWPSRATWSAVLPGMAGRDGLRRGAPLSDSFSGRWKRTSFDP